MTLVLPLPVTPRRTCWERPERTPATSCSMASGWSPAGLKGASTLKVEGTGQLILSRTDVRGEVRGGRRYPGMKDQIQGKAEELKGKVTGDKAEEAKGKVRDLRDDIKEEAERRRREHDADEALKRENGSR